MTRPRAVAPAPRPAGDLGADELMVLERTSGRIFARDLSAGDGAKALALADLDTAARALDHLGSHLARPLHPGARVLVDQDPHPWSVESVHDGVALLMRRGRRRSCSTARLRFVPTT